MTEGPLALGSLWPVMGVSYARVSQEQPDGKNNLSLALAESIRAFLESGDEETLRWLLAEIAEALGNPKAQLRLTLRAPKKGRIVSPIARHEYKSEALHMAEFIWRELQMSGQMEAALAAAQTRYHLSRSTVFARLKAAARHNLDYQRAKWLASRDLLELQSSWPSSTQTGALALESDDFDKWLNRYLDAPPADDS